MSGVKDKRKRMKSSAEKKRKKDKAHEVDQSSSKEENCDTSTKKKQRNNKIAEHETVGTKKLYKEDGSGAEKVANKVKGNENRNLNRKKKKNAKEAEVHTFKNEAVHEPEQQNGSSTPETQIENENHEDHKETDTRINIKTPKSMKAHKKKKKKKKKKDQFISSREDKNLSENRDSIEDDIYQIPSGDEDCSKGMKKWIMEYHQRRPGVNVLQERIDAFITEHEARVEKERKEREAQAAEDGWTVVVHHKGRKKTTDTESGVVVGSVAQATVLDKMTKKKDIQVGLDFYRFQRREAQRSELMMLQSKFEQDKKRIQQMRAARKFRPY